MDYIVVFITASTEEEASRIANGLVDSGSAACVNIIPRVKSVFIWEGKRETAAESLLIVKTKKDRFDLLKAEVKRLHSYDLPEIIALPIEDGDKGYLDWMESLLR